MRGSRFQFQDCQVAIPNGYTEQEAMENIADAISEYLAVIAELSRDKIACVVTIHRHNPVNAITMGNIVCDAGLTNEKFRKLL